MFRKFSLQNPVGSMDPITQLNWQTLHDNTKSSQYTPVLSGISSTGQITTDGNWSFYGPWVLVRIYVTSTAALTGTSGTISLPTPALSHNSAGGNDEYPQWMLLVLSTGAIVASGLSNNASGVPDTQGFLNITSGMLGTTTLFYGSGIYIRN